MIAVDATSATLVKSFDSCTLIFDVIVLVSVSKELKAFHLTLTRQSKSFLEYGSKDAAEYVLSYARIAKLTRNLLLEIYQNVDRRLVSK